MSFFSSFYSLGYSGIVLMLTFLFMGGLAYSSLKMPGRKWPLKAVFFVIFGGLFVFATFFLATTRADMMDALRDSGYSKKPASSEPAKK